MGLIENIKAECAKRKMKISQLEKNLGFSNGYISKVKPDTISAERLYKLADYLQVSPEYLITGKEPEVFANDVNIQELMDAADGCSPEDIRLASDMLRRLKAYSRLLSNEKRI